MITLSELKTYLGISGTTQDEKLQQIIDSCESIFENAIGGTLTQETITEKYSGDNTQTLILKGVNPSFPATYGTDSWIKKGRDTQTLIDEDSIEIDGQEIILVDTYFPCGIKNIEVKYQKGYAYTPEDVKQALFSLAGTIYTGSGKESLTSESIGDYSVSYGGKSKSYPPIFVSVVNTYRQFF